MLCERILYNIDDVAASSARGEPADRVALHWSQLVRRALRKRTEGGIDLRILLPLGVRLRHGDVIGDGGECLVLVDVSRCDVWIVRPGSPTVAAAVALELGNLHIPAEVTLQGEIIVCPDGPAARIFRRYQLPWEVSSRRFSPLSCEGAILRKTDDFAITKIPAEKSAHEQTRI